jgi:hypothetical protein
MSESTDGTEPTIGSESTLSPNVANVELAAPHKRRVSRVGAIAACAALLAGLGGFLLGRTSGRTSHSSAAITAGANDAAGQSAGSTPGRDIGATADANATAGTTAPAAIPMGDAKSSAASVNGGSGGQYSPGAYAEPAQTLVAQRTTSTGITLRAHRQDFGESQTPYQGQFGSWQPAGWCFPTGQLRISIVTSNAANIGGAPWYTDPKGGIAVATFSAGYVESSPVFGAAVQVGADVSSVTLTTASGSSDTTAPTKGLALLAINGPIEDSFTVALTNNDGTTTTHTSGELTSPASNDDYQAACMPPPPALPPAGDQPADPVAAEAAVRESWRISRDFGGTDPSVRVGYVDDSTGIEDAWKSLSTGPYADVAKTSSMTIKDFVFTSPTEAWFRYDIVTSITNFNDRYGTAHLGTDGVWRITRQTVCQDLALAPGTQCSPTVQNVLPPSAANDPRYSQVGTPTPFPVDTPVTVAVATP